MINKGLNGPLPEGVSKIGEDVEVKLEGCNIARNKVVHDIHLHYHQDLKLLSQWFALHFSAAKRINIFGI